MGRLSAKTGLPGFSNTDEFIVNYFKDPGFERGTAGQLPSGWVQYDDGATAVPIDGTGGSAVAGVTMLISGASPLRGQYSAVISKDAANRQGVGYAYNFAIANADKGAFVNINFELQTDTNYAAGDLALYLFDVDSSVLIAPRSSIVPKADNSGKVTTDYTLRSGTNYRVIFHIATTNASAWSVKLDTMANSTSRVAVPGASHGPWVDYSDPILGGGSATWNYQYRRWRQEGSGVRIQYGANRTASGSGTTTLKIPLPAGFTLPTTPALYQVGTYTLYNGATLATLACFCEYSSWADGFGLRKSAASYWQTGADVGATFDVQIDVLIPEVNQFKNGVSVSLLNQNTSSPLRAGIIQAFGGSVAPTGWLDCDGSVYTQAAYPQLFAQIGATWATCTNPLTGSAYSAPAAGSFRVPDLRGAFLRGAGGANAAGVTTSLAGYQADTTAKNGLSNAASSVSGSVGGSDGTHTHNYTGPFATAPVRNDVGNILVTTTGQGATTGTTGSGHGHSHSLTAGAQTITGDAETRPDNVGVKFIIKAWDESFNLAGFLLADNAGNAGLVQAGKVPGQTTGAAISAGYVGQVLTPVTATYSISVPTTGSPTALNSLSLTAGVWIVTGYAQCPLGTISAGSTPYTSLALSTNGASFAGADVAEGLSQISSVGNSSAGLVIMCSRIINTTGTTITLVGRQGATSGSSTWSDLNGRSIQAVRIA